MPPHEAWLGGPGVWRAKPDRLASQNLAVLHDGVTMWDAVRVLDAFPLPAMYEVLTRDLPEEDGKYDCSYGAPCCVLVADPAARVVGGTPRKATALVKGASGS